MRLGILPLGRDTFDVPFAEAKLTAMLRALDATGHEILGPRGLLFDAETTRAAIDDLKVAGVDQVLILQVTFTDASMTVAAGGAFDQLLSIWAVPEPRTGGRLRLNAFCGLNLAGHALGLNDRAFSWIYCDPEGDCAEALAEVLSGAPYAPKETAAETPEATEAGLAVVGAVRGKKIARIGAHPPGFDTCAYDAKVAHDLSGVTIDEMGLDALFDRARSVPAGQTQEVRAEVSQQLAGLEEVDSDQLDRSLNLGIALNDIRTTGGYDAFAIRCWPETFTEYGGAVCGPAAMLGEAKTPCACEADVYGALTQLILQEAAQSRVFLTDLVDIDIADGTGVLWHCGQAPISMCDPDAAPEATVHTNRRQPLLYQFPLKPGPVTILRISQSRNASKMVLGHGEMLKRPRAFTGTSGVIRFERNAAKVLNDIMSSGLEHHVAIAYGDHRDVLRGVAGALKLPLLEI